MSARAAGAERPRPLPRPRPGLEPVLIALLLSAVLLGIATGQVPIPARVVAGVVLDRVGVPVAGTWSETTASIVLQLRLPRTLLAAVVGAGLAGAGAVFQGLLRNPLADPFFIGVSAGAALGATIAITAGLAHGVAGLAATPWLAFAGAIGTTALVYALARRGDDAPVEDLVLAGVAVSALLGAIVSAVQLAHGDGLQRIVFWLMGGLSGRGWPHVFTSAPLVALGLGTAWLLGRDLNALMLGDEAARALGVNVPWARRILISAGALMAAAAVAAAGLIGFVGLIVPHLIRLLAGPDHRRLLPAATLGGAILLVLADAAARLMLSATELPVGILTAALGAPFFLLVLRIERGRFWT